MRRASRIAAGAAGLGLIAAPQAGAWEPPQAVSPRAAEIQGPLLAVNARGDALLAWTRGTPTGEEWGLPPASWVEAALRPAGAGRWSPQAVVSPADELAIRPEAVLTESGAGAVWWTRIRRGDGDVSAAEASLSSGVWAFRPLDTSSALWTARTSATAPDGTLAIAEVDPWAQPSRLRVRVRLPDGTWRESIPVDPVNPDTLGVAMPAGGPVIVAAVEAPGDPGDPSARTNLVVRTWDPASGTWGAVRRGTEVPGAGRGLGLVGTSDGAVATTPVSAARGWRNVAWVIARDGTVGAPRTIATTDGGVLLAGAPDGRVVAAWSDRDGVPVIRVRAPSGEWSEEERAPAGSECVEPAGVGALALGPDGRVLVVGTAGFESAWRPGYLRAWVRAADGAWTGPVWLARPLAGRPVAAIDGTGRMHVAWTREDERPQLVEATAGTLADAATPAVPGQPVATVSEVRVTARGSARTLRFRVSRTARVTVSVRRASAPGEPGGLDSVVLARAGRNAVPIRVRGRGRVAPGRWVVVVQHQRGFIAGCAVASRPFRIGGGVR